MTVELKRDRVSHCDVHRRDPNDRFAHSGRPALLREFGEFRYLFYGVALILMMRFRPEGLWPSPVRRRELRAATGMTAGGRAES
jgi:hypothetical protein